MLWWCIKILGREYPGGPLLLLNYPSEARRSSMWLLICCTLVLSSASRRSPSGPPSLLARRLCASSRRRCCSNSAIRSRISRRQPIALASMIPRGLLRQAHIYPLPRNVDSPSPTTRSLVRRFWPVRSGAIQLSGYGLLTAGCIDTDPPAVRRTSGRSASPHIGCAHAPHAMRVMSTEIRCENLPSTHSGE
jgi:hypothetical protein